MSGGSDQSLVDRLRAANLRLQHLLVAKDAETEALRRAKDAEIGELRAVGSAKDQRIEQQDQRLRTQDQQIRQRDLKIAELQRRLGAGSDDSGTPSSKESIEAKARRQAERRERKAQRDTDTSLRERSKDRKRGGQPGHPGRGLVRDPDPQQRQRLEPPVECRGCGGELSDAQDTGTAWSQIWDVKVIPWRTEFLLPQRKCTCCGKTTTT